MTVAVGLFNGLVHLLPLFSAYPLFRIKPWCLMEQLLLLCIDTTEVGEVKQVGQISSVHCGTLEKSAIEQAKQIPARRVAMTLMRYRPEKNLVAASFYLMRQCVKPPLSSHLPPFLVWPLFRHHSNFFSCVLPSSGFQPHIVIHQRAPLTYSHILPFSFNPLPSRRRCHVAIYTFVRTLLPPTTALAVFVTNLRERVSLDCGGRITTATPTKLFLGTLSLLSKCFDRLSKVN
ncbi:hypothetical protein EDD21DRAFT_179871 [Dissophora ornata]|nr:hypothetical protein EDD21DRAFT_179871 [Dissophora ornata]